VLFTLAVRSIPRQSRGALTIGPLEAAVGSLILRYAVRQRRNVLVAGGTSTGKTTLVNALLAEVADTGDRVVLIEDTRELQCKAPNLVALRTKDGVASSTRAAPAKGERTLTRFSRASSIGPIGCCSSSRASCRRPLGSPIRTH
jgi:type IV secretory pathway ATPase VirB11/archaellum biosynthesis ATPase